MSYEYDDEDYGGRVLWSRIAFFLALALLMFALGWCTRGGGPEGDVEQLNADIARLSSENTTLEAELNALRATGSTPPATDGESATADEEPTGGDGDDEEPTTGEGEEAYVVEPGDTLALIAERFLGDASRFTEIAERNGIDEDATIQVGQRLIIPADDGGDAADDAAQSEDAG